MSRNEQYRNLRHSLPRRVRELAAGRSVGFRLRAQRFAGLFGLLLLVGSIGCQSARPMPPANLSEPGWTVRQGQAVWHLPHSENEVAGEVLLATRPDGSSFVQFTKTPFPFVIAQLRPGRWEVEFPAQNKHYRGPGQPPLRIIWLQLPRVLGGKPPPRNWSWHEDSNGWRLENSANGESLSGYFAP